MGSDKNKKISRLGLVGIIVTLLSMDIVPLFTYGTDKESGLVVTEDSLDESKVELSVEEGVESLEGEILEESDLSLDTGELESEGSNEGLTNTPETLEKVGESDVILEDSGFDETNLDTKEEQVGDENSTTTEPSMRMFSTYSTESVETNNKYVLATDSDFSGTSNGNFSYIGDDEYVEIPHTIKGVSVTSYAQMFREKSVKGVKSTNKNINDMYAMFMDYKGETLDVSQLDTSGVRSMNYMFNATSYTLNLLKTVYGLENFDTSSVTRMDKMFYRSRIEELNLSNFNTGNVTLMTSMFSEATATDIDVSSFDTSKVTDMYMMFRNIKDPSLDIRHFNTNNVVDMRNMFSYISENTTVTGLGSLDTTSVRSMSGMFDFSKFSGIDVSSFDTSKVTDMSAMFRGAKINTLDLSHFDTSNVTDMSEMFEYAEIPNLNLNNFNTSKVTTMNSMFNGADALGLDLTSFDTSNVTDMIYMFKDTSALTLDVSSFDTSNVLKMTEMFNYAKAEELDLTGFDTKKVTDMGKMFQNSKAVRLDLRSFNTAKLTEMSYMFDGASASEILVDNFDTTYVIDMNSMFRNTRVKSLDLSSFDMRSVNDVDNMFQNTPATVGLARSSADVKKMNGSLNKSSGLVFEPLYKVPKDSDFSGFYNGIFEYVGDDEYIEMPHTIKGTKVTSYKGMFVNTNVKGVISTNKNVTDMSTMFRGNSSESLDVSGLDTSGATVMDSMFRDTQATSLNLTKFDTSKVTGMFSMFRNSKVKELDLGSFDLSKVTNFDNMFQSGVASVGYAKTQEEVNKFMGSVNKPSSLVFTVWGIQTVQNTDDWTNEPVYVEVNAVSDNYGIDYVEMVNETGRNLALNSLNFSGFTTNNRVTSPASKGYDSGVGATWVYGNHTSTGSYYLSMYNMYKYDTYRGTMYSEELYPLPEKLVHSVAVMSRKPITVGLRGGDLVTLEPNKWTRIHTTNNDYPGRPAGLDAPINQNKDIPLGTRLYFKELKIEEGTEPTPWKPAPEDSESSSGKEDSFRVYSNGTYVFRATDTAGNTKTVSHTVTNMDTKQPTATVTSSPEGWTSQEVSIFVEAEDTLSGVDYITLPNGEKEYTNSMEYTVSDNGTYTFTVTDKSGNKTEYKKEITNIDKSIPKLTASLDSTDWTNKAVDINVNSESSASGLKDIELVSSPIKGENLLKHTLFTGTVGDIAPEGWSRHSGTNGNNTGIGGLVNSPFLTGGNLAYRVKVDEDRCYLTNTEKIDVRDMEEITTSVQSDTGRVTTWYDFWDKDGNRVSMESEKEFQHYKDNTYYYTLKVPSGATHYSITRVGVGTSYTRTGEDVFNSLKVEEGSVPTPYTPNFSGIKLVNNGKTYPAEYNGLYTFKSTYNNGSTSEASVNVKNIDRTSPDIEVSGNVEDWTEEVSVTLDLQVTDTQSGLKRVILPDGKEDDSGDTTYTVTKNGTYVFTLEDNVGNTTTHTETVDKLMIPYNFYVRDSKGNPISGVEYELIRNDEVYKRAVSNDTGLVDFGRVPPVGKYQVRQLTVPDGVTLDPIDTGNDGFTDPVEFVDYPRGKELSATGTLENVTLGSMVIILAGGFVYIHYRKKKGNA